ncbi:hypothetical protein [Aeromicrobium sp. P5_D10]
MTPAAEATHVVGAIGQIDEVLRQRLNATFSDHVQHRLGTDDAILLTRGATYSWKSGTEQGILWSPSADPGAVATSDAATHEAVGPHLVVGQTEISLNSAAWGFQPVYVHQQHGALLFATTTSALLQLIDSRLDPDWDAWASIMMLGYLIGGRTLFTQIERLRECEGRVLDRTSGRFTTRRGVPRTVGRDNEASPDEVVEALRHALVSHPALAGRDKDPHDYVASLPLTGGYDSRLLGSIFLNALGAGSVRSVTTSTHRAGADPDVTFGTSLGDRFGVTQRILNPDGGAYPVYAKRMFDLLEHESAEHVWFEPVAAVLHEWGAPTIDGLSGDMLMKNTFVKDTLQYAKNVDEHREAFWHNMNRAPYLPLPGVSAAMLADMTARVRSDFDLIHADYEGADNMTRLIALATRSQRGVATIPHKVLAAGVEPVTPFMHPDVISALLSIPGAARADGALARKLLDTAEPGLGDLPSSNDWIPGTTSGRRRSSTPESYAWAADRFGVLNEFIGDGFTDADIAVLHSPNGDRWRLRLILLADWLDTYNARLTSVTPPWWVA